MDTQKLQPSCEQMAITNDILESGKSTVYSLFYAQVKRRGNNTALEYEGAAFSFEHLNDRVTRLASVFCQHGIRRGDRVAIISENRPEYVEAKLACAMIGAILACQNWRLSLEELKHCILLVEPSILLVSKRFAHQINKLNIDNLRVINFDDSYGEVLKKATKSTLNQLSDPEDGIVILYTSGTTGFPKGALISHRAEIARMCALRLDARINDDDAFVAWTPMFHMASTDQVLGSLMSGSTVIIIDGFNPEAITEAAIRHNLGWLVMLPGSIRPMITFLKDLKPSLQRIACVGAMADLVPRQEIAELTTLLNCPYLNSFGATETGLPPASSSLIKQGITDYSLSKKISSLCEVRLLNEHNKETNDGDPGELAIRGPTVFSGYWNSPKTNSRDFDDGWFRMGDLFKRNSDGTLDFVDRAKYMIKSGGENIYPAEIERILLADKRILDAVVVKKADSKWGEIPVAFIARSDDRLTESDVEKLCRSRLASYKRPKEVNFIDLKDLPRSTTGKIQRHEIETWV